MPRDWITGLLLILLLDQGTSVAQDRQEIERGLKAEYEGKVVWLRDFCSGSRCSYSPSGDRLENRKAGPWTLTAGVEVTLVKLWPEQIEVKGNRLFLVYDRESRKFKNVRSRNEVQVVIKIPSPLSSREGLQSALGSVFVSAENLPEVVPSYWKDFLSKSGSDPEEEKGQEVKSPYCGETETGEKIYRVEHAYGVSEPRLRATSKPTYTDEARQARLEGTVVIRAVLNRHGSVENPSIVEPLGMGLDESAVQAFLKFRFDPAALNGQPVAVCMRMHLTFRLM